MVLWKRTEVMSESVNREATASARVGAGLSWQEGQPLWSRLHTDVQVDGFKECLGHRNSVICKERKEVGRFKEKSQSFGINNT